MSETLLWLSLFILFGWFFAKTSRMHVTHMQKQMEILAEKDVEILRLLKENGELQKQLFKLYEERNAASGGTMDP